jgi:uncharacterized protein YndB with AHSA1/START domain
MPRPTPSQRPIAAPAERVPTELVAPEQLPAWLRDGTMAPFGANLLGRHRRLSRPLGDEFSPRGPSNLVPPW